MDNNNSSAVYNHSYSTGHPFSLENFDIISRANNNMDLFIHESLPILRDRPILNSQMSSFPLTLLEWLFTYTLIGCLSPFSLIAY